MKKDEFGRSVYTPQLSAQASATIKRLSFNMGKPMTKALEQLIFALPAIIDPSKICLSCQQKNGCIDCIFVQQLTAEEKAAMLAAF